MILEGKALAREMKELKLPWDEKERGGRNAFQVTGQRFKIP